MGSVFRQHYTKPIPRAAEIVTARGKRVAKWKGRNGRTQSAPLNAAGTRIVCESDTYYAEYTDAAGRTQRVTTGCKDRQNAEAKLAELERQAERVKIGVVTKEETDTAAHQHGPAAEQVAAYIAHMTAAGRDADHTKNVNRQLTRIVADCRFARLADLDRTAAERWLSGLTAAGKSARTRNSYLAALNAWCNWLVSVGRLPRNPFDGIPSLSQKTDPRHKRRALTPDELGRLLTVAATRPLDSLRAKLSKANRRPVTISPETVAKYERLGAERALIYKTLVLTGLRVGELASLTVGQLHLDIPVPFAELHAADEKNREGSAVPINPDLAADLRAWVSGKPPTARVFAVPRQLCKTINRDFAAAGIVKRDERGRVIDAHALRTTFSTLLTVAGVSPRTAQAALRHGDIALTMGTYTDPKLLDTAGAVGRLPALPLTGRLTGTTVAGCLPVAFPDQTSTPGAGDDEKQCVVEMCWNVNEKAPLSIAGSGAIAMLETGLEPARPCGHQSLNLVGVCFAYRAATGVSRTGPLKSRPVSPGHVAIAMYPHRGLVGNVGGKMAEESPTR